MGKKDTMKILIVRSATHNFQRAVDYFKGLYPEAEISVLVPAEFSHSLKEDKRIKEVHSSSHKGHFGLFKLKKEMRNRLKRKNCDMVVTLYNNDSGIGYLNVDVMALFLNGAYQMAYNNKNECFIVSRREIAKRFMKEGLNNIFSLFSIVIFSIIFAVIALSVVLTDGVRKLYWFDHGQA